MNPIKKYLHGHDSHCLWTTQSERDFLDGLGHWLDKPDQPRKNSSRSRFNCLMGYRDSIHDRVDWDRVDRNEVIFHLNTILFEFGVPPLATPEEKAKVDQEALNATSCESGNTVSDPLRTEGI